VALVERSGGVDIFSVGSGKRPEGEALSDILLVFGVDILGIADIDGDREASVRDGKRINLCLADSGPCFSVLARSAEA